MGRVKTVVDQIEEGNGQLLADRVGLAQAHTVKNGSGIKHAAEGTDEIEKSFRCEAHQIATRINRFVVEMADGAFSCFIDTSLEIQVGAAQSQSHRSSTSGFPSLLFSAGK